MAGAVAHRLGVKAAAAAPGMQAVVSSGGAGSLTTISLPSAPTNGHILVAVGFGYSQAPVVNTGAGWTAISAANHNAGTFDPNIRAAWKLCGAGESAAQTPFTSGGAGGYGVVIWEVAGLDSTWTPTFDAATPAWSASTGTTITASRTTTHAGTLCLVAAFGHTSGGTAILAGSLSAGWDSDGAQYSSTTRQSSTVGGHQTFPTTGTSASCTATFPNSTQGRGICLISVVPGP